MAGAVGIEPTQFLLERNVLPLYDAPTKSSRSGKEKNYFVSLCSVCCLHHRQNFSMANLLGVSFLFFLE